MGSMLVLTRRQQRRSWVPSRSCFKTLNNDMNTRSVTCRARLNALLDTSTHETRLPPAAITLLPGAAVLFLADAYAGDAAEEYQVVRTRLRRGGVDWTLNA